MTAVVHCLRVWRHYLLDQHFTIYTNNRHNELVPRYDRSFQIVAYIISIHLVFHISLLKAYNVDVNDLECNWPHCPPPMVQTHYDQAAITILNHQVINKGGCNHAHRNTFYLVQWAE
ncbi:unnamed protein product [Spirodela intermedia]|uniref:Uncharacterized protein n=1 Tax=Spirodela intermedia TaxID=51605 RepID=A0A7I8K215_SPIIN|nr:unnamed protein product [Spirodela intermedia]